MSTSDVPYSASVQEALISANLNSSMLMNFMMGIYTMVYAGTMYLYMSKKATNINRCIVLSSISVLYLLCLLEFLLEWYLLNLQVVIEGDTRESIFLGTLGGGYPWMLAVNEFLFYSSFLVSDGLLIWRCYHVWGRSFRVISVSLILFLAEFGLLVAVTVMDGLFGRSTNEAYATLFNNTLSALVFMSLGTTVTTTSLIGYRIHASSHSHCSPSKRLFNRVVVLVIESAAAYSVVLVLHAIATVVPSFYVLGSPWVNAEFYFEAVVTLVAGLAPTVLVARIALTNTKNTVASTITHISGLRFESQQLGGGHSRIAIDGDTDNSMDAGDAVLMGEEKGLSLEDGTYGGY